MTLVACSSCREVLDLDTAHDDWRVGETEPEYRWFCDTCCPTCNPPDDDEVTE